MENKADAENGFFQQVYAIVAQIPAGQTLSYGEIARMLGEPTATVTTRLSRGRAQLRTLLEGEDLL